MNCDLLVVIIVYVAVAVAVAVVVVAVAAVLLRYSLLQHSLSERSSPHLRE